MFAKIYDGCTNIKRTVMLSLPKDRTAANPTRATMVRDAIKRRAVMDASMMW